MDPGVLAGADVDIASGTDSAREALAHNGAATRRSINTVTRCRAITIPPGRESSGCRESLAQVEEARTPAGPALPGLSDQVSDSYAQPNGPSVAKAGRGP